MIVARSALASRVSTLLVAFALVAVLFALASCSLDGSQEADATRNASDAAIASRNASGNETDPYALDLVLAERSIPLNGSIRVLAPDNATVYVYRYCDRPGWLLKRDRGAYRYVFPVTDACAAPQNGSFTESLEVPLAAFSEDAPELLTAGDYEFKLFYSIVAPGDEMREANLYFTVGR